MGYKTDKSKFPSIKYECNKCGGTVKYPRDTYCGYCFNVIDWDNFFNYIKELSDKHELVVRLRDNKIESDEKIQIAELINKPE